MKKITIILLTAVYLLSAIGVSASRFYCCGILKTTNLTIGADHESEKTITKGNDCCKTMKQSFKVKDNHFGADPFTIVVKFFPAIIEAKTSFILNKVTNAAAYTSFYSHAPPFVSLTPIYTLNCAYRI
ncbi:hypothetical protein ACVWYN_003606 [Pedobacter sp. UYP24]